MTPQQPNQPPPGYPQQPYPQQQPGYPPQQPGYPPQGYQPAPPPQGVPPEPPKKGGMGLLGWLLIGCAGIILLGILAVFAASYFVYKGAKSIVDNPVSTAAHIYTMAHPTMEIVSVDEKANVFVVKDKQTGKVMTIDASKMDDGELNMTSSDGSKLNIGGKVDLPDWVPVYPGADPRNALSSSQQGQKSATFTFTTTDAPAKVKDFYKDALTKNGFTVALGLDGEAGFALVGDDKANNRMVAVNAGGEKETGVSVTYTENVK